jgi:hypothetical protein
MTAENENWNCPNCEAEIVSRDGWPFGDEYTCPQCGCQCEVDGDYCDGDGGWSFWLVESPEWIENKRQEETK